MVSKTSKYRGSRTHGRGKKGGRGWGKRGGHGMAGTHKHKWIWVLKHQKETGVLYFGRHGFKRPQKILEETTPININDLERMRTEEHVKVSGKDVTIDLTAMGYDKLLATGRPTRRYTIKVPTASFSAVEKIKAAGGSIEVERMPVDKEAEKAAKAAKQTKEAEDRKKKPATAPQQKPQEKGAKKEEGGKKKEGAKPPQQEGQKAPAPKPPKEGKPKEHKGKDAKEAKV